MKKALSVMVAVVLIAASGCERRIKNSDVPPEPPNPYSTVVNIAYGDYEMKAELTQMSDSEFKMKMLSPQILEPLILSYSAGECTVEYDGLEFKSDVSRFPQSQIGAVLTSALTEIFDDIDVQKTYCEGVWTYIGETGGYSFELTQDAESGKWMTLTVPGVPLKVTFEDK